MSLDELIGARLAVGFPGLAATQGIIAMLRGLHVRTVVVFQRNYESSGQFLALLQTLNRALGRRLLVMVDHEGGRVVRFRGEGVTRFPDAATMGRAGDAAAIERQGATEAAELRRLGVHVNLAPCVDVIMEGCDPIIGDRSYGADPRQVAACGLARIRGLQTHGVAACAKHFPGLGAVPRDPHKELPTIAIGWDAMEATHLVPFRAAIDAGVETVMSSHVCYPGLGEPPGLPATFSPRLIRALLRERMGFSGAILTDDLEMGALRALGTIGEASIQATAAGHDLLLICAHLAAAQEAHAALRQAYQDGRLDSSDLEASVARVERLRQKFLPAQP